MTHWNWRTQVHWPAFKYKCVLKVEHFANVPDPPWFQWPFSTCVLEGHQAVSLTLTSKGKQAASNFESGSLMAFWESGRSPEGTEIGCSEQCSYRRQGQQTARPARAADEPDGKGTQTSRAPEIHSPLKKWDGTPIHLSEKQCPDRTPQCSAPCPVHSLSQCP